MNAQVHSRPGSGRLYVASTPHSLLDNLLKSMDNFCDCNSPKVVNDMFIRDLVSCLIQINKINNLFSEARSESSASSSSSSSKKRVEADVCGAFLLRLDTIDEILRNAQG